MKIGNLLLAPLFFFILGIFFYSLSLSSSLIITIAITTLFSVGALLWQQHISLAMLLRCFFFFMLGIGQTSLQESIHKKAVSTFSHDKITLHCTVSDKEYIPERRQHQLTLYINSSSSKKQLPLLTKKVFSLRALVHQQLDIRVGDSIKIDNACIKTNSCKAPLRGINSFYNYLTKERILTYLYVDRKDIIVTKRPLASFNRWLWEKKNKVYKSTRKKLSKAAKSFYSLIFLGNKKEYSSQELAIHCNAWGISHFLARSGLHIALLIFMWQLLFSIIPLHITLKRITLMLLAIIYQLLSWTSISFLRAYLLFLFLHQGHLFSQRTTVPHLFSFICCIILLHNPFQLFFLDFQLSFGLTFALITFCLPYKPLRRKKAVH